MAVTITDFSPNSTEIETLAQHVGKSTAFLTADLSLPKIDLSIDLTSDPNASRTFYSNQPDILFTCEYIVNGQFLGILIVWEKYYNSTHYEVFKSNLLNDDDSYSRILFLDSDDLAKETDNYGPYLTNIVGLTDLQAGQFYSILDTTTKPDRLYQYYVKSGYYPKTAAINYDAILLSKNLINQAGITSDTDTVFTFATRTFGISDYAWLIALLNPAIIYFGKEAATTPLKTILQQANLPLIISFPTNVNNVIRMLSESIYFFGLKATISNMLTLLKPSYVFAPFFDLVTQCIDEQKNTLSYTTIQNGLVNLYPAYQRLNDISISAQSFSGLTGAQILQKFTPDQILNINVAQAVAPQIPIAIPSYQDTTSFSTFADFTNMFLRLNAIFLTATYANDNDARITQLVNDTRTNIQAKQAKVAAQSSQPQPQPPQANPLSETNPGGQPLSPGSSNTNPGNQPLGPGSSDTNPGGQSIVSTPNV